MVETYSKSYFEPDTDTGEETGEDSAELVNVNEQEEKAALGEVSGIPQEEESLVPQENLLTSKEEEKRQKIAANPFMRALVVVSVTGCFFFIFVAGYFLFSSKPSPQVANTRNQSTTSASQINWQEEVAQLKAKLALLEQESKVFDEAQAPTSLKRIEQPEEKPPVEPAPQPVQQTTSPPAPRPQRVQSRPVSPPPRKTASTPAPKPKPPQPDWLALAKEGASESFIAVAPSAPVSTPREPRINPRSTYPIQNVNAIKPSRATSTGKIQTVTIGTPGGKVMIAGRKNQNPVTTNSPLIPLRGQEPVVKEIVNSSSGSPGNSSDFLIPEAQLTLNYDDLFSQEAAERTIQPYQVPVGSTVLAKMETPLIWSTAITADNTQGQFSLVTTADLLDVNGKVALPTGTTFIGKIRTITANEMVDASIIAVIYRDRFGAIRQQEIPTQQLLVLNKSGQFLRAKSLTDSGDEIAGQDVLGGVLSAGRRGMEIINRPRSETIVSNSNSIVATTTTPEPNLAAGLAEGFFDSTSRSLERRSPQVINNATSRHQVYTLPANLEVKIHVASFLEIY